MFTNWKTTLTGVLSAAASFVLFAQSLHYATFPPIVNALAAFALVGGLAGLGITAKDAPKPPQP